MGSYARRLASDFVESSQSLAILRINRNTSIERQASAWRRGDQDRVTGKILELETVFGNLFREIEDRFPWLATWLGGRLEVELPAFFVSLTMHGLLLVCPCVRRLSGESRVEREFQSGCWSITWSRRIRRFRIWTRATTAGDDRRGRLVRPQPWLRRSPRHRARPAACPSALPERRTQAVPAPELASWTSAGRPRWSCPPPRCSARPSRSRATAPSTSAASRGPSTGSPPRSSAGWSRAHPGRLGVRRLGQPPGRAGAAEQAHRDGLHPHHPARREPPRGRQRAADDGVAFGQDRKALMPKPTADQAEILEAIQDVARTRPASRPRSPPSPRSSAAGAATRTRSNQPITRWSSS